MHDNGIARAAHYDAFPLIDVRGLVDPPLKRSPRTKHVVIIPPIWVMPQHSESPLLCISQNDYVMTAIHRQLKRRTPGKLIPIRTRENRDMDALQRIPFYLQNGVVFVDPQKVLFLEASSNYTKLCLASGKSVLVSKTLKYCHDVFPGTFLRIHKSFLINPDYLSFYHKTKAMVELDGNVQLPVSRSGKKVLGALCSALVR